LVLRVGVTRCRETNQVSTAGSIAMRTVLIRASRSATMPELSSGSRCATRLRSLYVIDMVHEVRRCASQLREGRGECFIPEQLPAGIIVGQQEAPGAEAELGEDVGVPRWGPGSTKGGLGSPGCFADVVAGQPVEQAGGVHQPVRCVESAGLAVALSGVPSAELFVERIAQDYFESVQALVHGAGEFHVPLIQAQCLA
jgi:hypothetical protein